MGAAKVPERRAAAIIRNVSQPVIKGGGFITETRKKMLYYNRRGVETKAK